MANINAEATRIWEAVPTPLYDELKSKHSWGDNGNEERCREYATKKFPEKYPGCPFVNWPPNQQEFGDGQNHYNAVLVSEKLCKLKESYNDIIPIRRFTQVDGVFSLAQVLKVRADKEKQAANTAKRIQNAQNNAERKRLSKIPTGNLLGLNTKNEPNMIKFEPTKNGLNNRSKELNGLFRKSRKNRKSRKTRKSRK
jgi:hypothetical protein